MGIGVWVFVGQAGTPVSGRDGETMNEPLVSVLIPVYNHARYVRQCLDSLLTEGWPNLEVLIIDDGSTDNSFEIIQGWRTEHPNAFVRFDLAKQDNQGLTKTLNNLVFKAKGEFITLLASDDYLLPGGISARIDSLQAHPNWFGVIGNAWIIDTSGNLIHKDGAAAFKGRTRGILSHSDTLRRELLIRWWSPGPTLLLRRDCFDSKKGLGLYDETISFEDRDYYIRLLARNALGFVDYPVAAYRVDPTRLATPPSQKMLEDEVRSELKNLGQFSGFDKFVLWCRAHRTLAKLVLKENPGSYKAKLRLWLFHGVWTAIHLHHRAYLRSKNLFSS
jgi:glycosyltransferase involved in cell wall biosynthesis